MLLTTQTARESPACLIIATGNDSGLGFDSSPSFLTLPATCLPILSSLSRVQEVLLCDLDKVWILVNNNVSVLVYSLR